jgi:DNA-binding NarL/FixJ family response regulator
MDDGAASAYVNHWEPPQDARDSMITIFVVDDHKVVREGLIAILDSEPHFMVVGQAESAEEALHALPQLDPKVVIVDYRLPRMDGLELCREIAERRLRAQIVVLSVSLEEEVVERALLAGARAYVVKDVESSELKRAIRAAARGETTIDPKVAGRKLRLSARLEPSSAPVLRPAHLNVLGMIVRGMSNAEIASETGLSLHTVKSYVKETYERLGVTRRSEAVAVALRRGLVAVTSVCF